VNGSADERDSEAGGAGDDVLGQLREVEVAQVVYSTAATLASLAYGKLETGELDQARLAIDALRALVPLLAGQVDAQAVASLEQVLANLQLAYAGAVAAQSGREPD
jgi:hypothetical protein